MMETEKSSATALWGTPIRYKEYHVSEQELDEMRTKIDNLADDCLLALHEERISLESFIVNLKGTAISSYKDRRIRAFAESVLLEPAWLDWEQVRQGQQVFLKHYGSAALGLLYVSLVGGFAAPKITKVLDATNYMTKHRDATWRRLNETFEMVVDCIDDDDSLSCGNRGFNSVLKVRFLHSRVRLNLLGIMRRPKNLGISESDNDEEGVGMCPFNQGFQSSSQTFDDRHAEDMLNSKSLNCTRSVPSSTDDVDSAGSTYLKGNKSESTSLNTSIMSDEIEVSTTEDKKCPVVLPAESRSVRKWDSEQYGEPINQEDMMVTLLSFSVSVLDTIEKTTLGGSLTRADEDAYIHLWRYIGYLIGVHEDYNPCTDKENACGLMESAVLHLLKPDDRSGELARHLLMSVANRPPLYFSYEMHSETARSLLGHELSDALGIVRDFRRSFYVYVMMKFTTLLSLFSLPSLTPGSARISRVRRNLRFIVNKALYSKKIIVLKKATETASNPFLAFLPGFLLIAAVVVTMLISRSTNSNGGI